MEFPIPEKDLIKELGPLELEEEADPLAAVTEKLHKRVGQYINFLEDLLQPDQSPTGLQEASAFDDGEREIIYTMFRKLSQVSRKLSLINLHRSEKERKDYLKELYDTWVKEKQTLSSILDKTIAVWERDNNYKTIKQNYFG